MFEIIDFHIHPFLKGGELNNAHKQYMPMDADSAIEIMDDLGISVFCGNVIDTSTGDWENIKECNRSMYELMGKYGERYCPGVNINPMYAEKSIEEVINALNNGVKIIGELVPYIHGYTYKDPGLYEIFSAVENSGMVVSMHTMEHEDMEKIAKSFKNLNFVFAHPGEIDSLVKHIEIMKRCENVYLDLSGTGLFRYGMLKRLCNEVGAERVLFGTDFPICNPYMYVGGVLGEKISDREKELIFSKNAKRLLNI